MSKTTTHTSPSTPVHASLQPVREVSKLSWKHLPAGEAGFFRAPVLLTGPTEAVLIDGGFTFEYYDGNPVGLGVGVCPPETLDQFGEVPDEQTVRKHIKSCLRELPGLKFVLVEREIIGPIDAWRVGVQSVDRFRIERPETSP